MTLLQGRLGKYMEFAKDVDSGGTSLESMGGLTTTTKNQLLTQRNKRYGAWRINIYTRHGNILLSILSMRDTCQIWMRLQNACDVQSSSRRLVLVEELFSLWLPL